jgi:hypothetical protein
MTHFTRAFLFLLLGLVWTIVWAGESGPVSAAIELEAAGTGFTAYYRETPRGERRGAILLLHGRRSGPDSEGPIRSLRLSLPERGWATLSLALSEMDAVPEAWLAETDARLAAGVAWVKGKNAGRIVVLGQDTGALAVLNYLRGKQDPAIQAGVLVETSSLSAIPGLPFGFNELSGIALPVLDLARRTEEEGMMRKTAFRANPGYRQILIQDADAEWRDSLEFLGNRIHAWLANLPVPKAAP